MVSVMMSSRDRCKEQRFLEHSRPVHCEGWLHGVHDALIPTYKVILHAKRVSVLRLPREKRVLTSVLDQEGWQSG